MRKYRNFHYLKTEDSPEAVVDSVSLDCAQLTHAPHTKTQIDASSLSWDRKGFNLIKDTNATHVVNT